MGAPSHYQWPTLLGCGCAVTYIDAGPREGDEVCCARCGPTTVEHVELILSNGERGAPSPHPTPRRTETNTEGIAS